LNPVTYYINTSSPDRSGILRTLSDEISFTSGNIAHFRQDLHLSNNNFLGKIHLLATWKDETTAPSIDSLKDKIRIAFDSLYKGDTNLDSNEISIEIEKREVEDDPLKTLCRFKINFFDRERIAGEIFKVFSDANLSAIESYFRLNSKLKVYNNRPLGRIIIFTDLTNTQTVEKVIENQLLKIEGIFNIEISTKEGYYSL